jgi:Domain of unknown function (DUF4920)
MKTILLAITFGILFTCSIFGQTPTKGIDQMPGKVKPMPMEEKKMGGDDTKAKAEQANVDDKTVYPLKRGTMSNTATKVSLAKILATPAKYSGKNVLVEGVIVRSCKMEGCWMELAPTATSKSIRIKMKDHGFFVPLNAAGLNAKAEGVFTVKTLSKEEVDHLMNEDGAKFDKINADGTVTEVAFTAVGVELKKAKK